jgi:SAM-dependent methyltransferase
MSRLFECNPTGRFTGLAEIYAKHRPGYPTEAINTIIARCRLRKSSTVVDVGCGTGILSRLLAANGLRVIGIEPNADMRAAADVQHLPGDRPKPVYGDGRAEATGLPASSADAVVAAQAFHWFEPEATLREFHRILKPDGWVALIWNLRDEKNPFTADYGAIIRTARTAAVMEPLHHRAGTALLTSSLFQNAERLVFANQQRLDEQGLLGRAFSVSYAPREPEQVEAWQAALRQLFIRNQKHGAVILRYETAVYLARRRDGDSR